MRIKLYFSIVCLFTSFSSFTDSFNKLTFSLWSKPDIEIFYSIPAEVNEDTKVLFVIHGASRTAESYFTKWYEYTNNKNIILIAPKFDKLAFPSYNSLIVDKKLAQGKDCKYEYSGYCLEPQNNPSNSLSDSISLIFDYFRSRFDIQENSYRIYGHSGGSQFVHRYLLFGQDARAEKAVMANAGWYTFLKDINYPYGVQDMPISEDRLKWFLSVKGAIMLGDEDADPNDGSLRNDKGAKEQGNNRFQRGIRYFERNVLIADSLDMPFRWRLQVVKNAAHENSKMIQAAAPYLLEDL